jgi:hypothetical protein
MDASGFLLLARSDCLGHARLVSRLNACSQAPSARDTLSNYTNYETVLPETIGWWRMALSIEY